MSLDRVPQWIGLVDLDLDRACKHDIKQVLGHRQKIRALIRIGSQVGRVKYSDPFWARMLRSIGSTAPEDCPKSTSPRGARQSNEAEKVSLPTESYTTGTMSELVI